MSDPTPGAAWTPTLADYPASRHQLVTDLAVEMAYRAGAVQTYDAQQWDALVAGELLEAWKYAHIARLEDDIKRERRTA